MRNLLAIFSGVCALGTWFAHELIKAWILDKVVHQMTPIDGYLVEYGIPAAFAVFCVWLLWFRPHKQQAVEAPSVDAKPSNLAPTWTAWMVTPAIVARLKDLANKDTNVEVTFFDASHFPFAERLSAGFEAAGWAVNFNRTAQGAYNPHHHGGIEVKGDNRYFVEGIAATLQGSGCSGVKTKISETTLKPSNPKYVHARNTICITIGYQE